jgi:hypothetical protein
MLSASSSMTRSRLQEIAAIISISTNSAPKLSMIRLPSVKRAACFGSSRVVSLVRGVAVAIVDDSSGVDVLRRRVEWRSSGRSTPTLSGNYRIPSRIIIPKSLRNLCQIVVLKGRLDGFQQSASRVMAGLRLA